MVGVFLPRCLDLHSHFQETFILVIMDPLSLTASIIAIIGVGGQAAKTVKKLASIKGAPDAVLAPHNEISDIRLIILAIQDVFEKQRTTGIPFPGYRASEIYIDASVISALEQANEKVLELEAMHDRLISFSFGHSGSTTMDKITWLRERKMLKLLQEGLRNARLKLAATLGVINS